MNPSTPTTTEQDLSAAPGDATDLSSAPISALPTHADLDSRARTLTAILAAIKYTQPFSAVQPNLVLFQYTDIDPSCLDTTEGPTAAKAYANSTASSKLIRSMKTLNLMAQLLVRAHEIVAVMPKVSRRTGKFSMIVSSDSEDSDGDSPQNADGQNADGDSPQNAEKRSVVGYVVARSPRPESPIGHFQPTTVAELVQVSDKPTLAAYLFKYPKVCFSTHVACMEHLINRIISTRKAPGDAVQLLIRYLTVRAAPKMHRRFRSRQFTQLLTTMRALTKDQVPNIVRKLTHSLSRHDASQFLTVLSFRAGVKTAEFPLLRSQYERGEDIVYNAQTAWEFHRLLLFAVEHASACVDALHSCMAGSKRATLEVFTTRLDEAEKWMSLLNLLIHNGAVVPLHISVLEGTLERETTPDPASNTPADNNDDDQEMHLAIATASLHNRAAQQTLWLAVSPYYAVKTLTSRSVLPKQHLTISVCDAPSAPRSSLHAWEEVVRGTIFPPGTPGGVTPDDSVRVLKAYASAATDVARTILHPPARQGGSHFGGKWHVEALLATQRYCSLTTTSPRPSPAPALLDDPTTNSTTPATQKSDDPHSFQQTFAHIGVSKRCCPTCTKLISLLFPNNPLTILSGHGNIYATALPPNLPRDVALAYLGWLEECVRETVAKMVRRSKRKRAESEESERSADSQGMSPGDRKSVV